MLRYGIPEYRLPKGWMDRELNHVWELGATFKPNMRLGRDFHLGDIIDEYDAIYVGIGCYKSNELGIPGEDADGMVNALENLYNSTRGIPIPRLKGARVVVIGGGFTAIDCTRTSVRQGAAEVTLVYRRDLKDMPAADEAHEAIEEGARLIFQAAPTRMVTGDERQGHRRRVPAHEARRARRAGPPPAGADARHRVHRRVRHRARRHRPGSGAVVDRVRARRDPRRASRSTAAATSSPRSTSSAPTSRRSSPRATCAPAPRPWSRPSARAGAPRTRWTTGCAATTSTTRRSGASSPSRSRAS